jgi:hypothetical protein
MDITPLKTLPSRLWSRAFRRYVRNVPHWRVSQAMYWWKVFVQREHIGFVVAMTLLALFRFLRPLQALVVCALYFFCQIHLPRMRRRKVTIRSTRKM